MILVADLVCIHEEAMKANKIGYIFIDRDEFMHRASSMNTSADEDADRMWRALP